MTNAALLRELHATLSLDAHIGDQVADDEVIGFLDALIERRRGPSTSAPTGRVVLTNNLVLKKLRIAFELKEPAVLAAFAAGGLELTGKELTPLFRKHGSKHHRVCTDAQLHTFLRGLPAVLGASS